MPSVVLKLTGEGFAEVPQHTPRVRTSAPPSEDIVPPEVKEFAVMLVTAVVVRAGGTLEISFLQPVINAKNKNAKK